MRGLSSRDVLVMVDGVPLNSAALGGFDMSDIPIASVERIEVLRGPEAALFGDNSAGGIINIVRRADKKRLTRYSLSGGSYSYLSSSLSLSDAQDGLDLFARIYGATFRGEFSYLNNNSTSLDSSDDFITTRENNEYDSWGFFTGLSYTSDGWKYSFDIDSYRARKGIPGVVTFPTPDADQSDGRLLLHFRTANDSFAGGAGEVDINFNWLRTSRTYNDPSGGTTGQPISSRWTERALGGSVEYSEFIGSSHYFGFGTEWTHDSFSTIDEGPHKRDGFGFYLRDEISLGDSLIIPALRYDSIEDAGSRWSPKLGWRHNFENGFTLKANWGTAFRAPTFEELYREEGFIVGNPDLLPEKTWMADAGFIYKDEPVRFEVSYFRGRGTDMIEYALGSGHRYRPLNFGSARLGGIEGSVRCNLDEAWRFEANVTHTRATDVTDPDGVTYGKQIPGRPKWDAYSGLVYDDPSGCWGAHIATYFAGGRYLTAANTKELPNDTSINLGFNCDLRQGVRLAFEVKNLFDEDLMDVRGFPLPGRTFIFNFVQEV
jgi:vitamin B12 transporter